MSAIKQVHEEIRLKPAGVIWDMDGVLVDTGEFHFQAWMVTLSAYDVPFSRDIFRATFGMNNMGILRLLLGEKFSIDLYSEISEQKEIVFRDTIRGQVELLPGVLSLLKSIKGANIPQAIGSSAPQANIDAIIAELGLKPFFQAIVSAVGMPSKPDPAVFLKAAQLLGVPPSKCVVIEDAVTGVEAAHRADMKCIALTTTNIASDLNAADLIVDGLDTVRLSDLVALMK